MKRNLVYVLLLLLLLGLCYWLMNGRKFSTLKSELRNFSVADTAGIDKIFMADKAGNKILLEKQEAGRWLLNGTLEANRRRIDNLLEAIKLVEVKSPVPDKDFNSVVADMASRSVKVEIYQKGKIIKVYYVGSPTLDQLGTYMLMENSSVPFITHIPGFNGYLSVRYFVKEREWKSKEVFNSGANEIASIRVDYPAAQQASFILNNEGTAPEVKSLDPALPPRSGAQPGFINYYLHAFSNIYYEGYDQSITPAETDSIVRMGPLCVMELKTKKGKLSRLQIFYKSLDVHTKQQADLATGKAYKVDQERYYALLNDEKDLIIIQDFVFGKLMRSYDDFFDATAQITP